MTQTLDVHGSVTELRPRAAAAPASAARTRSNRFGAFAVTFGIAFAIIYTVCEQMNWPLFTYHPAVGKLDFGMQPARRGEGPPMYWYGWLAISFAAAAGVGWIATMVSRRGLLRATVFCCVLAVLWPGLLMLAIFTADRVGAARVGTLAVADADRRARDPRLFAEAVFPALTGGRHGLEARSCRRLCRGGRRDGWSRARPSCLHRRTDADATDSCRSGGAMPRQRHHALSIELPGLHGIEQRIGSAASRQSAPRDKCAGGRALRHNARRFVFAGCLSRQRQCPLRANCLAFLSGRYWHPDAAGPPRDAPRLR
jgi:hypothetical protein